MSAHQSLGAEPRRFMFDTVFEGGRVIEPTRPKRSFTNEEVEAIRTEAFAAGERSAVAEAERLATTALGEVTQLVKRAMDALAAAAHEHRIGSAELALTAARKIADAALARFPEAPVAAALAALARELDAAPRLTVRCGSADPERLATELARVAEAAGYAGQLTLKPEPGPAGAGFLFDWGDGKARFDPASAADRVEAALTAALAAEGLHAEPLITGDPP